MFGVAAIALCLGLAPSGTVLRSRGRSGVQMLAVGEKAPVFELPDANGKLVKSSSFIAKGKAAAIFFFPAVDTPGCTKEAIAFSKSLKDFKSTQVIGISGGNTEKYVQWIEQNNLQGLVLLNDKGDAVRNLFKVPKAAFGLLPGRVTYVLDTKGVCVEAYDNLLDAESHVSCALNAV
jgi:peroxiredoxin Q/BCP